MRIFGKLVLAFVAVSAFTFVSALVGMLGIHRVQEAFNVISDGTVPELAFLGRLEASAKGIQAEAVSIALLATETRHAGGTPHIEPSELAQLQEASGLFDRLLTETLSLQDGDAGKSAEMASLKRAKLDLLHLSETLVNEVQKPNHDPELVTETLEAMESAEDQFRQVLGKHIEVQLRELELRQSAATRAVQAALILSMAVAVLSLLLAVMLGLIMARRVAHPLQRLSQAARDFGEGVQDVRVKVDSHDEISEVGHAFNDMADRLVLTTISRNELAREVRERQSAENQALEAKAQADAANAAKGQFLANMSHEIRTPLNAIIGFSELLQGTSLDELQARYVKTIRSSGTGLLGIVNDILDLSKIEANERVLESLDFDLHALVAEVLDISSTRMTSSGAVVLRTEYAPDLPHWFKGDPTALRQVLLNLVSNAIKFTDRGEVCVLVDALGEQDGKRMVRLRVRDTGIGIAEDKIEHIFQVFTQADASTTRQYGGTGLGLAITRSLLELMGARVNCQSVLGQGSEFEVQLPLLPAQAPVDVVAPPVPERHTGQPSWHVLVAEDNLVNQTLVRAMLNKLGHSVDLVENGELAVHQACTQRYDIVLLDLHMPVMGGLDAAQAMRRQGVSTPIIALTAAALTEDRQNSLAAGMNDFLAKPLQLSELQAMLEKWVRS